MLLNLDGGNNMQAKYKVGDVLYDVNCNTTELVLAVKRCQCGYKYLVKELEKTMLRRDGEECVWWEEIIDMSSICICNIFNPLHDCQVIKFNNRYYLFRKLTFIKSFQDETDALFHLITKDMEENPDDYDL